MMSEQVQQDTFEPPHHKFKPNIEAKLKVLLKEYKSQFAQDETSIGTTPLTKMSRHKKLRVSIPETLPNHQETSSIGKQ